MDTYYQNSKICDLLQEARQRIDNIRFNIEYDLSVELDAKYATAYNHICKALDEIL